MTALSALMIIGTAPSISFVRQPELSLHRLDHTQHAEVQKALSCAQLPTLDGSWRNKRDVLVPVRPSDRAQTVKKTPHERRQALRNCG